MTQLTLIPVATLRTTESQLLTAHAELRRNYPGAPKERQPAHVFYGGAHLFRASTPRKLGHLALKSLEDFAPDAASFAQVLGLDDDGGGIYDRIREKLIREPIEDLRIDFEDGYGIRSNEEEDHHARKAAHELAKAVLAKEHIDTPLYGIRIKPFNPEFYQRGIRTLDIFFAELIARLPSGPPSQFRIALPKVALREEVEALADFCSEIETSLKLSPNFFRIELMIERTQAIFDKHGTMQTLELVRAARGRCSSVHFGPYDYAASRNLMTEQPTTHFTSDFAREIVQVGLSGTGVSMVDGPTNRIPIGRHIKGEVDLTIDQQAENTNDVHRGWKLHFDHVRRALDQGIYRGWDIHPAQLPARYAATYSFFNEKMPSVAARLKHFVQAATLATRVGQLFDDLAMAQGLINFVAQAVRCGAVTPEEAEHLTGIAATEIQDGSFSKILNNHARCEAG